MIQPYLKRCCRATRLHKLLSILCPVVDGLFLGQYASVSRGSHLQTYLITLGAFCIVIWISHSILSWSRNLVCKRYIEYVNARRRWMKDAIH